VDPLGLTVPHPRLSWICTNPVPGDRGQSQTAYQVLVSSTASALAEDKGDLWDSGKIVSDQSLDVAYDGRSLESGQACFWKLRVWDRDDKSSPWSLPASWSMGALDPATWSGQWIGAGDPSVHWKDFTLEANLLIRKEAASIYFRATGPGDSYMWQINTTEKVATFRPHVRVNGNYRVIKTVPLDRWLKPDDLNRAIRISIVVRGNQITTSINGNVIDTTTDDQHGEGSIGFRASPTEEAVFQNVLVADPSGKSLFSEDFTKGPTSDFKAGQSVPQGLLVSNTDCMLQSGLRTPRLRHEFKLKGPVSRAWVYASALGIYELRLNGQKVGDRFFTPGWTNYRKRIEYQTYDVTSMLRGGSNAIAAQLAPGWYAGNIGWFGPNQYGAEPRLFAELHVQYADGTSEIVNSDASWKASHGPLISSDFQDGETYDARLDQPGWDQPGFDDHVWRNVDTTSGEETSRLISQIDPPMRITREWKPTEVTEPKPGTYIYRLPQNITGVARIKIKGAPGTSVTLRHAEALNADGTLNLITLNSPGIGNARAHNIDSYTFGSETTATFQPHFTWRGFQYVEVTGLLNKPSLDDVTGLSIGTDVPLLGELNTSSELINRINLNMHWSGRDAFMSIPMDCPQRSERLGWAGDANFYLATAVFNFDMSRFFSKWENDLIDSQGANGCLCHVAPGWSSASDGGYGGGWGDVAICIPCKMWQTYGDIQPMQTHYAAMAKWIDYLQHLSADLILPASMAAAGDWQNRSDPTPQELCATAYFAYDVKLMIEMADALAKTEDAQNYRQLFNQIKTAFAAKFITADGKVSRGSQTAYVLALHIGLVPDELRSAAAEKLVANLSHHSNKLTTGFVGTQWLLPVLTDIGRSDLAYTVLEQTSKPSWGYMVSKGSTTIWENWSVINENGTINAGPNSLNHCALGSCGDWLYENIGGIRRDPAAAAFKRIIIQPRPGGGLTHAEAKYRSPYGLIATQWRIEGGHFFLDVTIPVGTKATIVVPATSASTVTESKTPASAVKTLQFIDFGNQTVSYGVGSGSYSFESEMP
jgi:alpha-L-rhamnosidase